MSCDQVDTFTFGGHDTTGVATTYALYLIGHHPDVQEKLHMELDDIFGDDHDRHVTKDDIHRMTYMEAVIKETLRLYPSAPSMYRTLTEELVLSDKITLPKGMHCWSFFLLGLFCVLSGTQVGIPILALHRDPRLWPDSLTFDPERFADENYKMRHPFAYIPFSAGPRNCIGYKFALIELKIMIANVLRKFRLQSLDEPDGLNCAAEMILRPKSAVRIRFTDRNSR